nr:porin [Alphaproteobacteria bacterium]
YTPEADDNSRGTAGNDNDDNDADPSSDVWDLAVRYQGDVGETKLTLGAGYTVAQVETGTAEDRQAWNLGAVVGFKGFNIGASYQNDDEGDDNDDVDYVAVGVDYTMGDYVLGASYYNKNDDVGTEIDTDRYTVGVNYKAGPGISFRGSVEYLEADVTGGNDFDGTAVLVGTSIDF